jgi:hypothetical protein
MALNYTIQEISGNSNLRLPIIGSPTDESTVKSPEWMVKIDELLTSHVLGFNNYTELLGWHAQSSRESNCNISSALPMSATLKHSDVILVLPNGPHAVPLETKMNTGSPLDTVTIARLGHVKVAKVKLQTIEFTKCSIKAFQQELDRLVIHLAVSTKTNTLFVFDAAGGPQGQMVSRVDYSQNTAE